MELIQSFTVDHTRIIPGIFTSRVDHLGEFCVTTYDVRLRKPNREPVIDVAAIRSSTSLPPFCATIPTGKTRSSTGARWAA